MTQMPQNVGEGFPHVVEQDFPCGGVDARKVIAAGEVRGDAVFGAEVIQQQTDAVHPEFLLGRLQISECLPDGIETGSKG